MKIFVMGSCRVQSSLRTYKRLYNKSIDLVLYPPLMHTIEQFIQAIEMKKKNKISKNKDIFDLRWGKADFLEITKQNRFGRTCDLQDADVFVIEICGVTNYINSKNIVLHPFPKFYNKKIKYKTMYSHDIKLKLKKLQTLLNKPMVIVTNHNIYNKESRTQLYQTLLKYCNSKKDMKIWNPTNLIKKETVDSCLKDINHFTNKMKKLQAENILKLCEELQ